jgi:hypothetical protein
MSRFRPLAVLAAAAGVALLGLQVPAGAAPRPDPLSGNGVGPAGCSAAQPAGKARCFALYARPGRRVR